eukprot:TRINITY_DN749_c0_g1_i2.p1 TRINITY_DN749_c0_g1~~TRINITY_DN749_c0_g1_i2.p1  ORF type:complete len:377 (-),score=-26.49 TRINITY_DN749_c0_g1_i2:553-1683(-)
MPLTITQTLLDQPLYKHPILATILKIYKQKTLLHPTKYYKKKQGSYPVTNLEPQFTIPIIYNMNKKKKSIKDLYRIYYVNLDNAKKMLQDVIFTLDLTKNWFLQEFLKTGKNQKNSFFQAQIPLIFFTKKVFQEIVGTKKYFQLHTHTKDTNFLATCLVTFKDQSFQTNFSYSRNNYHQNKASQAFTLKQNRVTCFQRYNLEFNFTKMKKLQNIVYFTRINLTRDQQYIFWEDRDIDIDIESIKQGLLNRTKQQKIHALQDLNNPSSTSILWYCSYDTLSKSLQSKNFVTLQNKLSVRNFLLKNIAWFSQVNHEFTCEISSTSKITRQTVHLTEQLHFSCAKDTQKKLFTPRYAPIMTCCFQHIHTNMQRHTSVYK